MTGAQKIMENETKRKTNVKSIELSSSRRMPVLGQGTWGMGEDPANHDAEIGALRLGLDLGMQLIDTAEMYGEGRAEELVGEAIAGRREEVYLVSKVYPHNATKSGTAEACARSLQRLKTDYLDLYLLHWRGATPLAETLDALQALKKAGKIRDFGVSNFDVDDLREATALAAGKELVVNQVLYNLANRGIEWDLLPWCREQRVVTMAYSPLESASPEQATFLKNRVLRSVAERRNAKPAQVAIAWLFQRDVVVIPKAANPDHVRDNRAAYDLRLEPEDLAALEEAFPPPSRKLPLPMR